MKLRTDFLNRRAFTDEEAEKEQKIRASEADADLRWLVRDPRGLRVLKRFFTFSNIFRSPLYELRTDSTKPDMELAYLEGSRLTAYAVFNEVRRVAPEVLAKLLIEHEEEAHG